MADPPLGGTLAGIPPLDHPEPSRAGFGEDFRRFFLRGLATLLPTLITLWLLFWVWNTLWENIGRHIIWVIKSTWYQFGGWWFIPRESAGRIRQILDEDDFGVRLLGVGLAILLVYTVGVFVGNLIGRTMWRIGERTLMRLPLVRAIYPSVKQVTDFVLSDRSAGAGHFSASRVVAVQARAQGVWAIGLITGQGYRPLNDAIRGDMVTVFIPSSPTAVAGYVVVAHREAVVELPLTVEEALRLLVSGGVVVPPTEAAADLAPSPAPAGGQGISVEALRATPYEPTAPPAVVER